VETLIPSILVPGKAKRTRRSSDDTIRYAWNVILIEGGYQGRLRNDANPSLPLHSPPLHYSTLLTFIKLT
jgi:hypothetical protein